MAKSLTIKTKLRFKDTFRYHMSVAFNTVANYIFMALSLISLGMFVYNMINGKSSVDERFTQSFILLIPPFIFIVNVPLKVWKATTNLLKTSVLKDQVTYTFTKEQIRLKTTEAEADVMWDNYIRIVETGCDFRLYIDKIQAQIVPKYSLSKEEIKDLRMIIKSAVDPTIIKLKES